jgi:hypothetical protein
MRLATSTIDKNHDRTSRFFRGSNGYSNRGFGDSEYIDVFTRREGHRSFKDDSGARITDARRCATIRNTLGLGD